jgi:hypothetical protein
MLYHAMSSGARALIGTMDERLTFHALAAHAVLMLYTHAVMLYTHAVPLLARLHNCMVLLANPTQCWHLGWTWTWRRLWTWTWRRLWRLVQLLHAMTMATDLAGVVAATAETYPPL